MKKLLPIVLLVAWAGVAVAGSVNVAITGPTKILPAVNVSFTSPVWAVNTAYSQGAYVFDNGFRFMCVVAGTSGSAAVSSRPSLATANGTFTDTNGITQWYKLNSTRKALVLQTILGTNAIFALGYTNTSNQGIPVEPRGSFVLPIGGEPCWDGEVWATCTGCTVRATEW